MVARHIGIAALAVLVSSGSAGATDLARCDASTSERLRFIEERLAQRQPYATWWWRTGQTVDILLDVTEPGIWMAHCHIAEHHETGMMFNFEVAE